MAEIILHIGTAKTGTTSIQHFLFANSDQLTKQGIYYPADREKAYVAGNAHFPIAAALASREKVKLSKLRNSKKVLTAIDELKRDLGLSHPRMILSCEHLSYGLTTRFEIEQLANLFAGHTVKLVLYLRNQADHFLASYATSVLYGGSDPFIQPEVDSSRSCEYYLSMLRLWSDIFGRDNMIVRPYERDGVLKLNIVDDFCDAVGIRTNGLTYFPRDNESLGVNQILALRLFNSTLETNASDDQKFINEQNIRDRIVAHIDKGLHVSALLTSSMRDMILTNHMRENEEIEAKWFCKPIPRAWIPGSSNSNAIQDRNLRAMIPNDQLVIKYLESALAAIRNESSL